MFKISLAAARVNAGYKLDEVAQKIHKTKNTIIAWEKGKRPIDAYVLKELCILYDIPMEFINLPCNYTQSGMKKGET